MIVYGWFKGWKQIFTTIWHECAIFIQVERPLFLAINELYFEINQTKNKFIYRLRKSYISALKWVKDFKNPLSSFGEINL